MLPGTILLTGRNARRPIHRLPVETLSMIFEYACQEGLDFGTSASINSTCSLWRSIAVKDPRMWRLLDSVNAPAAYADLAVVRSRSIPLSLVAGPCNIRMSSKPIPWVFEVAGRQAHRLAALEVRIPEPVPASDSLAFTRAAPMLKELTMQGPMERPVRLPMTFGNDTPKLRTLTLHGCRKPWLPGMYSNLTSLTVSMWTALQSPALAEEDILVVFKECPALETLNIYLSGHDLPNEQFQDGLPQGDPSRLMMHHLRSVDLHMDVGPVVRILSAIQLPPTIQRLHIDVSSSTSGRIPKLFDPRCLPPVFYQRLRTLNVSIGGGVGIALEGLEADSTTSNIVQSPLLVCCRMPITARDLGDILDSICSHYDMPLLTTLKVRNFSPFRNRRHAEAHLAEEAHLTSADGLAKLFCHLAPTVTSISLSFAHNTHRRCTVTNMQSFTTIVASLKRLIETSPSPTMFPELAELSLHLLKIRDTATLSALELAPSLQVFLDASTSLRKVEIHNSGFSFSSIEHAAQFVGDLRGLDVAEFHWSSNSIFCQSTQGEDARRVPPEEVWPNGEKYTWLE